MQRQDFFDRAHVFIRKLKALLFEIALLVGFVIWLWSKIAHDLGL